MMFLRVLNGGKMNVVNLTPHPIVVRGIGDEKVYEPSGIVPRLIVKEEPDGAIKNIPVVKRGFAGVENMPAHIEGTIYIVSSMLLSALSERTDVVAPDTGKTCIRDEKGRIVAVTRFCR